MARSQGSGSHHTMNSVTLKVLPSSPISIPSREYVSIASSCEPIRSVIRNDIVRVENIVSPVITEPELRNTPDAKPKITEGRAITRNRTSIAPSAIGLSDRVPVMPDRTL